MQADVILKEPPPWVPPSASQGGARIEGGAAHLVRPCCPPHSLTHSGNCIELFWNGMGF